MQGCIPLLVGVLFSHMRAFLLYPIFLLLHPPLTRLRAAAARVTSPHSWVYRSMPPGGMFSHTHTLFLSLFHTHTQCAALLRLMF
jgi:hypothetical protein